ncbi:MAG TPA: hypothetical protein PKC21_07885 [Oligoflexia bacterium]|nr:hypothetical protein [Oligoflexia bacterium]HMR25257.1 hypothetical protein [Oligoflexia bacterium]
MHRIKYLLLTLIFFFNSIVSAKGIDIFVQSVNLSVEDLESRLQTRDAAWIKQHLVGSNTVYMQGRIVVNLLFPDQLNLRFSCHGNDQNYHCDLAEDNKDLLGALEAKDES